MNNDNDFIFVGSTAGQDNGDLDLIAGIVNVLGGVGVDRLYVNDHSNTSDFDYRVTGTSITDIP